MFSTSEKHLEISLHASEIIWELTDKWCLSAIWDQDLSNAIVSVDLIVCLHKVNNSVDFVGFMMGTLDDRQREKIREAP